MKYRKTISLLVLCIAILSLAVSVYGLFTSYGQGKHEFISIYGEKITIYGKGLYQHDSVSMAEQALAQDTVTMIMGLPLLVVSIYLARKNLLKGKLMLAGTLGYFLYTYISYSFLAMYNSMFLIYVILMSASFFAFILTVMSFDFKNISSYFNSKMPVKFIGGFLIFLAVMIGFMWLGRIVPPLINGTSPEGLEHYTTLVIQALDLGFIVPVAMLSGVLLIKRKPFGYLLSSIMIIKGVTLLTAITAMAIRMLFAGVKVSFVELTIFSLFNLIAVYCLVLIMKNIMENSREVLNDKQ